MNARLLILSDTHGQTGALSSILMKVESMGKLDAVLHLGDGWRDLDSFIPYLPPIFQVAGNCDLARGDKELLTQLGAPILMAHGHLFGVKSSLLSYAAHAREMQAKIALFGHTHTPFQLDMGGLLLLNPGAAMDGHFSILEIKDSAAYAKMF